MGPDNTQMCWQVQELVILDVTVVHPDPQHPPVAQEAHIQDQVREVRPVGMQVAAAGLVGLNWASKGASYTSEQRPMFTWHRQPRPRSQSSRRTNALESQLRVASASSRRGPGAAAVPPQKLPLLALGRRRLPHRPAAPRTRLPAWAMLLRCRCLVPSGLCIVLEQHTGPGSQQCPHARLSRLSVTRLPRALGQKPLQCSRRHPLPAWSPAQILLS